MQQCERTLELQKQEAAQRKAFCDNAAARAPSRTSGVIGQLGPASCVLWLSCLRLKLLKSRAAGLDRLAACTVVHCLGPRQSFPGELVRLHSC